MEQPSTQAPEPPDTETLRSRVAERFGIDALDLTGEDVDTLLAQAQRLAAIDRTARLAHANVAPREGTTEVRHSTDRELSAFVAELFGHDDYS